MCCFVLWKIPTLSVGQRTHCRIWLLAGIALCAVCFCSEYFQEILPYLCMAKMQPEPAHIRASAHAHSAICAVQRCNGHGQMRSAHCVHALFEPLHSVRLKSTLHHFIDDRVRFRDYTPKSEHPATCTCYTNQMPVYEMW